MTEVKELVILLFGGRAFQGWCKGPEAGESGVSRKENRADKVKEVMDRACADQDYRSLSKLWLLLRVAGSH